MNALQSAFTVTLSQRDIGRYAVSKAVEDGREGYTAFGTWMYGMMLSRPDHQDDVRPSTVRMQGLLDSQHNIEESTLLNTLHISVPVRGRSKEGPVFFRASSASCCNLGLSYIVRALLDLD